MRLSLNVRRTGRRESKNSKNHLTHIWPPTLTSYGNQCYYNSATERIVNRPNLTFLNKRGFFGIGTVDLLVQDGARGSVR